MAMDWIGLFTSFQGRISRQPFWIAWAVFIVFELIIALATSGSSGEPVAALADLALIYPQFAVCAKRGHDRNTPTWVIGLFFAFVTAFDLLLLTGSITAANLKEPTTYILSVLFPISVFALVLIIDLGFRRGNHGPNRYGPDPLEQRS
jgi:uncharacterized membrane protein YhaH (DUF805 family)